LPSFAMRHKWFHPKTIREISQIKAIIDRKRDPVAKQFLMATLSAVITSCTGRKGKEHGYFADNTPLEKGLKAPPYQHAVVQFLERLKWNLQIIERHYIQIEKEGFDPQFAYSRARVVSANVMNATPADYGVQPNTVAAIVTSPPYLCMADYTLGQRLSYELLFPDKFATDYNSEIGKRRQRSQGIKALVDYKEGMEKFVVLCTSLLKTGGYAATVLGTPTAKQFVTWDATAHLDELFEKHGFEKMWQTWRPINWHRNHGYARLERERVSVHVFK
jgi:hypothetical protein